MKSKESLHEKTHLLYNLSPTVIMRADTCVIIEVSCEITSLSARKHCTTALSSKTLQRQVVSHNSCDNEINTGKITAVK